MHFFPLLAALSAFPSASAQPQGAGSCGTSVATRSAFCLAISVVEALQAAHVAALTPLDTAGLSQNPVGLGSAMLYQSSRQRSGIEQALEVLRPYATSPDTAIRGPALEVAQGLLNLRQVSFAADSALRDALDGIVGSNSQQAQRVADLQSRRHESARYLILAVIGVTYALIEADPSVPQRTRLRLTSAQRDELVRRLNASFGSDLRANPATGQWRSDFAAAVQGLDVFLKQDWRTRAP